MMMMALHRLDRLLLRMSWLPSLVLLVAFLLVLAQAADRSAPFAILSVEPAAARPGEMVVIRARVWRDTSRNCSASMSRSVFDAHRTRYDYPMMKFSDAVIDSMERATPGELLVSVMVPPGAAAGPADLVSVLEYSCNQVHALWPVEVTTVMPFTVLE